jgi:uncharacterized membrane protein
LLVLTGIVAAFGPVLAVLDLPPLRLGVGALLLLFGLRWLRKAILRAAGVLARHDETRAFAQTSARMRAAGSPQTARWDRAAIAASFNIVMLEGIEVVFIVTAVGTRQDPTAPSLLEPAIIGAGCAALLVIVLGLLLHRPIARLPENALKFAVSVLLSSFGLFWIGEASGLAWPGGDLALLGLVAAYGIWALVLVRLCRRAASPPRPPDVAASGQAPSARAVRRRAPVPVRGPRPALAPALKRAIALFVDDPWLGIGVIVWIAFTALVLGRPPLPAGALALEMPWRCTLFALGPALMLGYRAVRAATVVL